MEDMYKQAILDAKAVRASAMANAKASLQEAFEPRIQEMIRLKLSEELEEDLEEDENDPYSEKPTPDKMGTQDEESWETSAEDTAYKLGIGPEITSGSLAEDDDTMDDASLEDILAELEELAAKENEDEIMEAEEDEESKDEESEDEESDEAETEDTEDFEEAPTDDTKVIDITLGDLKQVLQSIQGNEMGSEDGEETESGEESEEPIDMNEILNSLEEAKEKDMKKKEMKEKKEEKDETKESLKEAVKTINILRNELNEVNLLNAKLLYMNKIFKSKNLSESQKVNVVSALDRATNTKEAKNIYETLKENISTKKSQIQESRGFASSPAGVAPKKPILESDAFVSRWQKIAGIK